MDAEHLRLAVELRHELHRHPELACKETWTKQRLIGFLREHTGLEIVDRGRWFYAVCRAKAPGGGKPPIAFRADFDALPIDESLPLPYASLNAGVSHKCGHDGHSASLAGLALGLERRGASRDICLVFQHAEETVEGGRECAPLMAEAGIGEVYAYHNVPGLPARSVAVPDGTAACGSTGIVFSFTGRKAHASQPEDGRNPCFAIAEMVKAADALADPKRYRGLVMCTVIGINAGKEAFGMAASEGRLLLTIRARFDDELDALRQSIEKKAREEAERWGLGLEVSLEDSVPAAVNHPDSAAKVRSAARSLGLSVLEGDSLSRGSEDFGWFTKKTPGALFWLGAGEGRAPIHTPEYDFNDDIIPTAVDLFGALIDM